MDSLLHRPALLAVAALALAACADVPPEVGDDEARFAADQPPIWNEAYSREIPALRVPSPDGTKEYDVYSLPEGREVRVWERDKLPRPATPEEAQYAIERYEALHRLPPAGQDDAPVQARRAERAAAEDYDDELLARMERTIRMWEEERRELEIRKEAAHVAGLTGEETKVDALIADYDRRIALHEMRKRLYTSPEWKAGRMKGRDRVLMPEDVDGTAAGSK